jgi:hypothetical protein
MPRASVTSTIIALPVMALFAFLLPGCASTAACEEWGTRVESVKVCNSKGSNCTFEEQPVQYCVRKSGQRAASAPGSKALGASGLQPKEERQARAPEKTAKAAPAQDRPEQARETPNPGKTAMAAQAPHQPKEDRRAKTRDKSGMPNLSSFWQSLFSASRYSGLRYGKVKKVTTSPATTPASSTQVAAALKTDARSVISMQVASDSRFTPMDHRLGVMVYRAHDREAAVALYSAMMRDEWRDRKPKAQPGVTLVVVKTGDKNHPEAAGQRIYLQRGSYVVVVDEWKSIYRDAAGKPVPGKQFPHSPSISSDVVAKAVTKTFPVE